MTETKSQAEAAAPSAPAEPTKLEGAPAAAEGADAPVDDAADADMEDAPIDADVEDAPIDADVEDAPVDADMEGAPIDASDALAATDAPAADGSTLVHPTKVYMGNIEYGTTEEEVNALFKSFGELTEVALRRGFAFINFALEKDALEAVDKLHGTELKGRALRVEISRASKHKKGNANGSGDDASHDKPESRHLFVAEIPAGSTEDDVKKVFEAFGTVEGVKLLHPHHTRGFVDFESLESARTAHGTELTMGGSTLRTDYNVRKQRTKSNNNNNNNNRSQQGNGGYHDGRGGGGRRGNNQSYEYNNHQSYGYNNQSYGDRGRYDQGGYGGGRGGYDSYQRDSYRRDDYSRDSYRRDDYSSNSNRRDDYAYHPRDSSQRDSYRRNSYRQRDAYDRDDYQQRDTYYPDDNQQRDAYRQSDYSRGSGASSESYHHQHGGGDDGSYSSSAGRSAYSRDTRERSRSRSY